MSTDQLPHAIQAWLDAATADAARRGLPGLVPMLETLALATAALRRGSWNDDASGTAAPK